MGPLTSVLRFVETLPGKIVLFASVMAASLGVVVAAGVVADTATSGPALAAVQTEQSFTLSFAIPTMTTTTRPPRPKRKKKTTRKRTPMTTATRLWSSRTTA